MRKRPFQNLSPQERRNLALTAVFAFYAVYIGMGLHWNNLFTALGTDYLAFWGAGHLANTEGYARAYDLEALRRVQDPLIPEPEDPSLTFTALPALVLPVFLLPFQALALLPAAWSLLVWTVVNVLLLFMYLRFFAGQIAQKSGIGEGLTIAMMLSFPVWWTLVWGQVNILLLACVGEFLRGMVFRKPFRAGLWLAGLLLKPQTLVLILPALFLQRSWKALGGFAAIALLLMLVSLGIGGMDALRSLAGLWLKSARGLPTNDPQFMMNWRMVGIHLSSFLGSEVGWGIALVGVAVTVVAALYLWRRPRSPSSPAFGIALLGTMAATGAATWHAHLHMMVIIIPPLLYLLHQRRLPLVWMDVWLFLLPTLMLAGLVLDLMGKFRMLPFIPPEGLVATQYTMALTGWGLNLCLLLWALRNIHRL